MRERPADYSDVNRLHYPIIRMISVDKGGGCVIELRMGGGFSANSVEEADAALRRIEKNANRKLKTFKEN